MRERPGQDRDPGPLRALTDPASAGSPGRQLCQLPRSPANRVDQKLAVSRSDDLAAGLEIAMRIGKLTLELGDAIGQQPHVLLREV
jgi:hypothetical protein